MPKATPSQSLAEKIAWYCLLAIPVAVPLAIGRIPFSAADSLSLGNIVVEFFALSVLVALSLIAWATALLRTEIPLRDPFAKWWLVGFLGLATASTVFALNRSTALFGESDQMLGLVTFLLGAAIYFLATQLVTSPARLTILARAAVIGGFGVAAIGTLQNFAIDPLSMGLEPSMDWLLSQAASTIGNPDSTGTFLVAPLVLSATLVLAEKNRAWRIFEGVALAVIAYALFVTLTRGAWIGAIVGIAALLVAHSRSAKGIPKVFRWLAGGLVILLGVGLYQLGPAVARRFAELGQGASAGGGRLILWREALIIIARHPLLGVGPDSYRYGWFPIRLPEGMRLVGDAINNDPHNLPLLIAATLGIPAAVALLVFFGLVLVRSTKAALAPTQSAEHIVFAGWWAAMVGFSIALFFTFNTIPAMVVFWLCLGVLSAPAARPVSAKTGWLRVALPAAVATFGVAMIVVSTLTLASVYNLVLAKSQQSLARSQTALGLAPWHYNARVEATFQRGLVAVLALQNNDPGASELIKQAERSMDALVAFNPYALTGYSLKAAFLQEVGTRLGDTSLLERAVSAADAGLKVQPTSIEMATKKASALAALGRFPEASDAMARVWDLYPADPAPGVLYADLLIKAGRTAKAKAVLATLDSRFPDDAEVARLKALLEQPK